LSGVPLLVHAKEDVCGIPGRTVGTVFVLSIGRSMSVGRRHVEFKLCERGEPSESFVLIEVGSKQPGQHVEIRQLRIDETTFVKLVALYERALDYDVKDNAMGNDGSSWCLETTRGLTYSKVCLWSPDYNTTPRHLEGMLALGRQLWHLAGFDSDTLY
jgi:hypothetical protein